MNEQSIKEVLDTDFQSKTTDELIELCVYYQSFPHLSRNFPFLMTQELDRRYPDAIPNEDMLNVSVIRKMISNPKNFPAGALDLFYNLARSERGDEFIRDHFVELSNTLTSREVVDWITSGQGAIFTQLTSKLLNSGEFRQLVLQNDYFCRKLIEQRPFAQLSELLPLLLLEPVFAKNCVLNDATFSLIKSDVSLLNRLKDNTMCWHLLFKSLDFINQVNTHAELFTYEQSGSSRFIFPEEVIFLDAMNHREQMYEIFLNHPNFVSAITWKRLVLHEPFLDYIATHPDKFYSIPSTIVSTSGIEMVKVLLHSGKWQITRGNQISSNTANNYVVPYVNRVSGQATHSITKGFFIAQDYAYTSGSSIYRYSNFYRINKGGQYQDYYTPRNYFAENISTTPNSIGRLQNMINQGLLENDTNGQSTSLNKQLRSIVVLPFGPAYECYKYNYAEYFHIHFLIIEPKGAAS